MRLIDRFVADGLVERRAGRDKRSIALHLTEKGGLYRERLLEGRLAAIRQLLTPLSASEREALASVLQKLLTSMPAGNLERCQLCRLCDNRVCTDCPIPADFEDTRQTR